MVNPHEPAIVKFIRKRLEWARVRVEGPMQKDVDETIALILPAILSTIGKVSNIDVDAAEAISVMLSESVMSEDGEKEILEAVDRKVNILGGTRATAKQELMHPEHYQSTATWHDFDQIEDVDSRLLGMAKRLKKCGCKILTEKSFGAATAVALHKLKVNSRSKLENTRTLKRLFASVPDADYEGPEIYPTFPEPIRESHPALWEQIEDDGKIVSSKIDEAIMMLKQKDQPCRKSRVGCGDGAALMAPMVQFLNEATGQRAYGPSLAQFQHMQAMHRQLEQHQDVGPRIVYNNPNHMPGQFMQPQLALHDINREEVRPEAAAAPAAALVDVAIPGATIAPLLNTPKKALAPASDIPLGDFLHQYRNKVATVPLRKCMKIMKVMKEKAPPKKTPPKKASPKKAPVKKVMKIMKSMKEEKPAASAKATVNVKDDLSYKPEWKSLPRYYGCATIYVDKGRGMWRVKPGKARRDDRKFKFGTAENKVAVWRELVAHVKSIQ